MMKEKITDGQLADYILLSHMRRVNAKEASLNIRATYDVKQEQISRVCENFIMMYRRDGRLPKLGEYQVEFKVK